MPPRAWRVRVEDMLEAIGRIEQRVEGLDLDGFCANATTVEAVAFNLPPLVPALRRMLD